MRKLFVVIAVTLLVACTGCCFTMPKFGRNRCQPPLLRDRHVCRPVVCDPCTIIIVPEEPAPEPEPEPEPTPEPEGK